jgi:hypothetical protein
LAKLLSKLEGKDDPTTDVMKVLDGDLSPNSDDTDEKREKGDKSTFVHRLAVSSASEFGRSSSNDDDKDDADHHDEYLQDLHEEDVHNHHPRGHMHDFFQRAFHGGGRSHGFSGPFGFGSTSSGGGFRYFSSSSGNRHGGPVYGEHDDHQVECNQM